MRTRGRFTRSRSRKTQRDAGPVSSRGSYRAVPLPRFRREVVALLVAGRTGYQRLDAEKALRLVVRWDRMVRLRHLQGKPPCNVADHILKYEKQQVVCPCGNPLPTQASRDKDRAACPRCKRLGRSRDPSRWKRMKAWRDRKMVSRREDFEGMTYNVGEVTRAAARGQMPDLRNLRPVKNPISRLVSGDPGKKPRHLRLVEKNETLLKRMKTYQLRILLKRLEEKLQTTNRSLADEDEIDLVRAELRRR